MTDTNTTLPAVPTEKPAEPPVSAEELVRRANGFPGTKTIPTDEYIEQREEKRREKKGGVRYKIDKLTKQTAEAQKEKAEAQKATAEVKERLAAIEQRIVGSVPVHKAEALLAQPAKVDDKPDPRPKREDFTDEGEFTTKIAEWVVRQQNKIVAAAPAAAPAAPPAPEKPKEVTYDPTNPEHVRIKVEFDRDFPAFQAAGQEFIKANPNFTERLNAAAGRGLTLDNMAQRAIIKLKSPQVLYYLADPANEAEARALMGMDSVGQVVQIGLIHDKLQVKASDFVSNAPKPGQHLTNGSTRATIPRDQMEPDDYIKLRIQERRSSKFRH